MNITNILDRLEVHIPELYGRISLASDITSGMMNIPKTAETSYGFLWAWVTDLDRESSQNRTIGANSQHYIWNFSVVIGVRDDIPPMGSVAFKRAELLGLKVASALAGFKPEEGYDLIQSISGKLDDSKEYSIFWRENFSTVSQLIRTF